MTSNPEGGAHRRATVLAVGGSVFDARQVVSRVGELEHLLHSGRPREQFHRAAVLAGVRAALKQEAQTRESMNARSPRSKVTCRQRAWRSCATWPEDRALAPAGEQHGGWRAPANHRRVLALLTFLRAHDTAARRDADA